MKPVRSLESTWLPPPYLKPGVPDCKLSVLDVSVRLAEAAGCINYVKERF